MSRDRTAADVGRTASITARLHEWVITTDHKKLGVMYIGSGLVFFVVAGLMAGLIRWQLVVPNNDFLSPQVFNRLFTMHGTAMVFLVGMPIIAGLMNYLVPLMIGTRDMAFPRLNAFGFWIFLFGGALLFFSILAAPGLAGPGAAPDVGWFAYAPLTGKAFSKGHSTDYWILAILLVSGIGSIASAINVIVTIFEHALPGNDADAHAALRLDHAGDVVYDRDRAAAVERRADHAPARPVSGRKIFRHAGRRLGGVVAALLLDLWPSGGLYPDDPGLRLRFGNHPCLLAQAHLRLRRDGRGDGDDRLHQHGRVGAPHVHGRDDVGGQHLFRHLDDAGGGAHGHQDVQLDRHDVRRQNPVPSCRCCSASRSSFSF